MKPLDTYEQSLLLVAMLFSRKNIEKIWQHFPVSQASKLAEAGKNLKNLEKIELIKCSIMELKKLLNADKNPSIDIDEVENNLKNEPEYLHAIIKNCLSDNKKSSIKIPDHIILQSFFSTSK